MVAHAHLDGCQDAQLLAGDEVQVLSNGWVLRWDRDAFVWLLNVIII